MRTSDKLHLTVLESNCQCWRIGDDMPTATIIPVNTNYWNLSLLCNMQFDFTELVAVAIEHECFTLLGDKNDVASVR